LRRWPDLRDHATSGVKAAEARGMIERGFAARVACRAMSLNEAPILLAWRRLERVSYIERIASLSLSTPQRGLPRSDCWIREERRRRLPNID